MHSCHEMLFRVNPFVQSWTGGIFLYSNYGKNKAILRLKQVMLTHRLKNKTKLDYIGPRDEVSSV